MKRTPLKRGKSTLRRTPMKRKGGGLRRKPMKRTPPKPMSLRMRLLKEAFRDEARGQRCCAVCGTTDEPWDAHHVIEKAYLAKHRWPLYVPENALRLCRRCHERHTLRTEKVPMTALTDENVEYAIILMGEPRAEDYFRRNYEGWDTRFTRLALALEQRLALED